MNVQQIKNLKGDTLYECDAIKLKDALESAVKAWANLSGANLSGANLGWANLGWANLSWANLSGSDLSGANLSEIKRQFIDVLKKQPKEVLGLRQAVLDGKIDGSQYEGECACLVGTIAKVAMCDYRHLPGLDPDSTSLSEKFFTGIRPGDTPKNNQISKIVLGWIDEYLNNLNK